jgi:hypothetical protein
MIERKVWMITDSGRDLGMNVAKRAPSHIHLPRRRRIVRPDDQSTSPAWGAHASADVDLWHAQRAAEEA